MRSDIEYEVNLKAELEVAHLHEKMDRLTADVLGRLAKIQDVAGKEARTASLPSVFEK